MAAASTFAARGLAPADPWRELPAIDRKHAQASQYLSISSNQLTALRRIYPRLPASLSTRPIARVCLEDPRHHQTSVHGLRGPDEEMGLSGYCSKLFSSCCGGASPPTQSQPHLAADSSQAAPRMACTILCLPTASGRPSPTCWAISRTCVTTFAPAVCPTPR